MITRNQIIEELKKHQGKDRDFKKEKISKLIDQEQNKDILTDREVEHLKEKEAILNDLESYGEY